MQTATVSRECIKIMKFPGATILPTRLLVPLGLLYVRNRLLKISFCSLFSGMIMKRRMRSILKLAYMHLLLHTKGVSRHSDALLP